MKTIKYITPLEFTKIPYSIKYFFDGHEGFWIRNNLSEYTREEDDLSEILKKNLLLDNSTEKDFNDLIQYITKMQDNYLMEIEEHKKRIGKANNALLQIQDIGKLITGKNNMKQNLLKILKL